MTAYRFHSDAGHGWLQVTLAELVRLGIAGKITGYSYRLRDTVFLEEDCDASLFNATKLARGERFDVIELAPVRNSNIRNFPRYDASQV